MKQAYYRFLYLVHFIPPLVLVLWLVSALLLLPLGILLYRFGNQTMAIVLILATMLACILFIYKIIMIRKVLRYGKVAYAKILKMQNYGHLGGYTFGGKYMIIVLEMETNEGSIKLSKVVPQKTVRDEGLVVGKRIPVLSRGSIYLPVIEGSRGQSLFLHLHVRLGR